MDFIKILILSAIMLIASTSTIASSGMVTEYLAAAQFTTRVVDRTPIDYITNLTTDFKKVLFFVDVRECKGCDIEHEWWYNGIKVFDKEAESRYPRYRWWTSKTLNDSMVGKWTVKVFVDGTHEYTKSFSYYKPTKTQRRKTPVQQRVMVQEADECEVQLRYFSDKLEKNPDEVYYKFMMKKWGKRCLGE